jgi:hypothetical protein
MTVTLVDMGLVNMEPDAVKTCEHSTVSTYATNSFESLPHSTLPIANKSRESPKNEETSKRVTEYDNSRQKKTKHSLTSPSMLRRLGRSSSGGTKNKSNHSDLARMIELERKCQTADLSTLYKMQRSMKAQ